MPLLELDARSAWTGLYANADWALWPRSRERWEPLADPHITSSFKLVPGGKIFTMGSCFARNIEKYLAQHGFDLPTDRYLTDWDHPYHPDPRHVVNLYHPYAMLQELRWALNLAPRLPIDERLIQVGEDAWIDPYRHHGAPYPKSVLLDWIDRSNRLFGEVAGCSYFVITLGLIEVWYDRVTSAYANAPLNFAKLYAESETLRNHFADRFVFRVLSFEESMEALEQVFDLLRRYGAPDCKAILTVSPVPLNGSFGGDDVLVGNMYSKSVLRAAAEHIVRKFCFVDYFPSYEMVMLSPRAHVWEEDGIHVSDAAVAEIVARMLKAYVG